MTTTSFKKDLRDLSENGCVLAIFGFVVSLPLFFISTFFLYEIYYTEQRHYDTEGDYHFVAISVDTTYNEYWATKNLSGIWEIETPYFFAHDTKDVSELENWQKCKLIISPSGSYELIQPPALLVRLLSERIELEKNEEENLLSKENSSDLLTENGSLHGEWSGHLDYKKRTYFNFQLSKDHVPMHIQMVEAREEEVKKQRLDPDWKLHWSTCSSFDYPKEGIIWKKLPVETDESAQKETDSLKADHSDGE